MAQADDQEEMSDAPKGQASKQQGNRRSPTWAGMSSKTFLHYLTDKTAIARGFTETTVARSTHKAPDELGVQGRNLSF